MLKRYMKKSFCRKLLIGINALSLIVALCIVSYAVEMTVLDKTAQARADVCPTKSGSVRVTSIKQANIKKFEKVNQYLDSENYAAANTVLNALRAKPELTAIEKAYIANFKGNIHFSKNNLNGALTEFKKVLRICDGISPAFYNQIVYVVAQVYFSKEDYRNALDYAEVWKNKQTSPPANAFMLIGQAQYMLKQYDRALPNVQKGISMYKEAGQKPKEGWLNLLAGIYRNKNDYKKMLPVYKQLVSFYPKKTYLLALGGVYNELNEQNKMTALYQAIYDQGLMDNGPELVTLASLLLSDDNPSKAAQILSTGMKKGQIQKNVKNNRLLAQSLMMAKDFNDAIAPLTSAASADKNGKLYNQLGQTYSSLSRWAEAESAFGKALNKGGLSNTGQTLISRGMTQFEQKKYTKAKATFQKAKKYDKSLGAANNWIKYVDAEVYRQAEFKKDIVISSDVEPAT